MKIPLICAGILIALACVQVFIPAQQKPEIPTTSLLSPTEFVYTGKGIVAEVTKEELRGLVSDYHGPSDTYQGPAIFTPDGAFKPDKDGNFTVPLSPTPTKLLRASQATEYDRTISSESTFTIATVETGPGDHLTSQTPEQFAAENGFWLVRKSDALEIVSALKLLWGQTQPDISLSHSLVHLSPVERLRREADRIEQQEKDRAFALSVLDKWQKRADSLRD